MTQDVDTLRGLTAAEVAARVADGRVNDVPDAPEQGAEAQKRAADWQAAFEKRQPG